MKISCIIPSQNRQTLQQISLPSVLGQTSDFHEIIVVFDLLESDVREKFPKDVQVIYTGGGLGGPAARKLAYTKTSGEFVVLLDDDDALSLNFVKELSCFLAQTNVLPSLTIPRVRKIWPEGFLPSAWSRTHTSSCSLKHCSDISNLKWMPSTSSGLVINRNEFPEFPVNEKVQGFNDVQICEAARRNQAPIYFCPNCIVYFYQYFSIDRLTSNLKSRAEKLQIAKENGLELSEPASMSILVSTLFSQARSTAYKFGFFEAIKDIRQSLVFFPYLKGRNFSKKILQNLMVILWLSAVRLISRFML